MGQVEALADERSSLRHLFRRCTVRVRRPNSEAPTGAGFFVGPGLVVTCAHVVQLAGESVSLDVVSGETLEGVVMERLLEDDDYPDLALIQASTSGIGDFVALDPDVRQGDVFISNGFSANYPDGDGLQLRYDCNFDVPNNPTGSFFKLAEGQVEWGFSGGPLLNLRTGAVCGFIKSTRNFTAALGGRAVSASVILDRFSNLLGPIGGKTAGSTDWQLLRSLSRASKEGIDARPSSVFKTWAEWANDRLASLEPGDLLRRNVVASPLEKYWKSFVSREPWMQRLRAELARYNQSLRSRLNGFPKAPDVDGLSYARISETVREWALRVKRMLEDCPKALVEDLSEKVQALLRNVLRLLDPRREPLATAFLVIGPQGSGKTQFLRTCRCEISQGYAGISLLLLPLGRWMSTASLEEQVLAHVCQASGGCSWNSLRDLNAYLQITSSRLVIVVDDFEQSLRAVGAQSALEFLALQTCNDAIVYAFAMQDTYASLLSGGAESWALYGYEPGRQRNGEQVLTLSGWIDLADLNRRCSVGYEILGNAEFPSTAMALKQRGICPSPLEAQLLLELLLDNPTIDGIAAYSFMGFIKRFLSLLTARADQLEGEAVLLEGISQVAHAMVLAKSLEPPLSLVMSCLNAGAEDAQRRLDVLRRASLLGEGEVEVPGFGLAGGRKRVAQVNYPFIWKAALADELWTEFKLARGGSEDEALDWLKELDDADFREGVWEFVLLLADHAMESKQITRSHAQKLWSLALVEPALPYRSLCFAARWATDYTQRKAGGNIRKHASDIVAGGDLFAVMFFATESGSLSANERLMMIRPFYSDVGASGLGFYLVYAARRTFQRADSLPHIENCLAALSMSHLSSCQEELATFAWEAFANIAGKGCHDAEPCGALAKLMAGYLKYDTQNAREESEHSVFDNGRLRRPFRQEVIACGLRELLTRLESPRKAFEALQTMGWYDAVPTGISVEVAFQMTSESNLAFGRNFRILYSRYRENERSWARELVEEYVTLVMGLLDQVYTQVDRSQELGYFMLRHTDFAEGKTASVPKELWGAVDLVEQLPALARLRKKYPVSKQPRESN